MTAHKHVRTWKTARRGSQPKVALDTATGDASYLDQTAWTCMRVRVGSAVLVHTPEAQRVVAAVNQGWGCVLRARGFGVGMRCWLAYGTWAASGWPG
jgi:hypothetical protein